MKFGRTFFIWFLLVIVVTAGLMIGGAFGASGTDEAKLKAACIQATIRAIGMEIKNYERKLDAAQNGPGAAANIPGFKKRITELKTELKKYQALDPAKYTLPEKKTVTLFVKEPFQDDAMLELEDMTRSGPFYHLAGIRGDDYQALENGQKYVVTVYLVYKRDYVLPLAASFYVYISDYTVPYALSPRQTGVEILEELALTSNTVTIKVASNGCTDKSSFRVDIQKEAGIKATTPHYVLTFQRIKPDECKAIVDEGVVLTYDLQKDLGLNGAYTVSVVNRVYSKLEGR